MCYRLLFGHLSKFFTVNSCRNISIQTMEATKKVREVLLLKSSPHNYNDMYIYGLPQKRPDQSCFFS
jgi:hypothetical protein